MRVLLNYQKYLPVLYKVSHFPRSSYYCRYTSATIFFGQDKFSALVAAEVRSRQYRSGILALKPLWLAYVNCGGCARFVEYKPGALSTNSSTGIVSR